MTPTCGSRTIASDPAFPASESSTAHSGPEDGVPEDVAPKEPMSRRARHAPDIDECIARFQERGDRAALDTVMAEFDWLASACARRLQRRGELIEDLEQVAREGLLGAVARFDVTRGAPFKSFAWATVLGALRHYYRGRWQVRVPRGLQEMHLAALKAIEDVTAAAGRAPTIEELATHTGMHREDVILALDAGHAYRVESLDRPPDDHQDHTSRERVLAYVDEPLESAADRVDLRAMLDTLPPAQRKILEMRFFEAKTQDEIGVCLGVSQVHVSRLMRAALADLRSRADVT